MTEPTMKTIAPVVQPDRREWHLDKTVSISHLLTTLSIASAVFMWAMTMDKRVAVLEEKQAAIARDVDTITQRTYEEIRMLRQDVMRIAELAARQEGRGSK